MLVGRWTMIKINNVYNLQIVTNAVEKDEAGKGLWEVQGWGL